jgi:HPr kinase/phosphorylase
MYLVKDLYEKHAKELGLELTYGKSGLNRRIKVPEAQRPGLSLCGYLKNHADKRIIIFGKGEIEYLRDLDSNVRTARLEAIITTNTPAIIIARRYRPSKELRAISERQCIPLFRTNLSTMNLLSKLTFLLTEDFAPTMSCHGTLVEVFGVGVLIQGDSAVGKSEAALGLIERGHRLISDDMVKVKKKKGSYLEGSGAALTRYHMEIRGIGIINVAHLYGAVCIRNQKSIDIVVRLVVWQDDHFYDRVGLDEKITTILDVNLPYHVLPVKPGRDVVLLLETIALNHRLKEMGYNSAQEFSSKVLELTAAKSKTKLSPSNSNSILSKDKF